MSGGVGQIRRALRHLARAALVATVTALVAELQPATGENGRDDGPAAPLSGEEICGLIQDQAQARDIPPGFLARLIWQESRFDALAISPKGAQGIAQFMPATASERALKDPFDVASALAEAAAFLAELRVSFGNLGLAAAAYNAGPDRVRRWIAGYARLPLETRHYVRAITGMTAEEWQQPGVADADFALDGNLAFENACTNLVTAGLATAPGTVHEGAPVLPWGVQVAAHFSRDVALSAFGRLQQEFHALLGDLEPEVVRHRAPGRGKKPLFAVRIGAETRQAAEEFCHNLRAVGGSCVVLKN